MQPHFIINNIMLEESSACRAGAVVQKKKKKLLNYEKLESFQKTKLCFTRSEAFAVPRGTPLVFEESKTKTKSLCPIYRIKILDSLQTVEN